MKKKILIGRILFIVLFFGFFNLFSETVVLLNLKDKTKTMNKEVLSGAKVYLSKLISSKYRVVNTKTLKAIQLKQKRFLHCENVECFAKLGKLSGADGVLIPFVDYFAGIYTLTIDYIDVERKFRREAGAVDFNGTAVGMKNAVKILAGKLEGKAVKPLVIQKSYENKVLEKYSAKSFKKSDVPKYVAPKKVEEPKLVIEVPGKLVLSANVKAKVTLDFGTPNQQTCTTPCHFRALFPGKHLLRFESAGFLTLDDSVLVQSAKTVKKTVYLKRSQASLDAVNNALIEASAKGKIKTIKRLLRKGADINWHNESGMSPLLSAVLNEKFRAAYYLKGRGAKFSPVEAGTILLMVAKSGDKKLLRILISQHSDMNYRYENNRTILWEMIKQKRYNLIKYLIKAGLNPNLKDSSGQTVVDWVIENGYEKAAKVLASSGVRLPQQKAVILVKNAVLSENIIKLKTILHFRPNLNVRFNDGLTVLWYAVLKNRADIVEMLLNFGAKANIKDKKGISLMKYCIDSRKFDIAEFLYKHKAHLTPSEKQYLFKKAIVIGDTDFVRFLLKVGVNVNTKFKDGLSALWIAAFNNDREMIDVLASFHANLNIKDNQGRSVLMWCVENKREDVARKLMTNHANPNLFDKNRRTALFFAVNSGNLAMTEMLVKNGAKIDLRDKNGISPLLIAVARGNFDITSFLVKNGAFLNIQDKNGNTPLLISFYKGFKDISELLLQYNADINKSNNKKITPLITTAQKGDFEFVKTLVEKGADIDAKDSLGLTALIYAERNNRREIVLYLLGKNAKITTRKNKNEMMAYACLNSYHDIVKILLDRGISVNRRFSDGLTPMWYAVRNEDIKLMRMLHERGADLEARNKNGDTPLLYSVSKRSQPIVLELLKLGANINVVDRQKSTPLMIASARGFAKAVELLIKKGADVNAHDSKGRSALVRAKFTGNFNIVEMLKSAGAYE